MAIIEQNGIPNALPDFRNLGVLLRTLLTVNLATMLAALLDSASFGEFAARFALFAALVEP
jgi:two-component system sensor histidine kinase AlgZ